MTNWHFYDSIWTTPGCTPTTNVRAELEALKKAHAELAAMVHARLDRLEAASRTARFGYNGGL
jgi:hypothetical protein